MTDGPNHHDDTRVVVDWLVDGARSAHAPQDVLAQLCERLVACGLPLHRVAVFVRTLHPDIMGRRLLWRPGAEVVVNDADYAMLDSETYHRSPVRVVFTTAQPIRLRIEAPDCPRDYPIVAELRAEGVRDYLIQPLPFTSGEVDAISWTTTRPGGSTTPISLRSTPSVGRLRASSRSTHCVTRRSICSTPTSAGTPASASCGAGSGAATSSASKR
jgi:hypothetical protein